MKFAIQTIPYASTNCQSPLAQVRVHLPPLGTSHFEIMKDLKQYNSDSGANSLGGCIKLYILKAEQSHHQIKVKGSSQESLAGYMRCAIPCMQS